MVDNHQQTQRMRIKQREFRGEEHCVWDVFHRANEAERTVGLGHKPMLIPRHVSSTNLAFSVSSINPVLSACLNPAILACGLFLIFMKDSVKIQNMHHRQQQI